MTRRVRSWNSLIAMDIQSCHGEAVERQRFRQFLYVNEVNESELLFLKKLWKKNRIGDESICRFMERMGWFTRNNDFTHTPCVEGFGFEAAEFPSSSFQLAEIGARALRNGTRINSLFDAIFSLFSRQHASVTTTAAPLPSCK